MGHSFPRALYKLSYRASEFSNDWACVVWIELWICAVGVSVVNIHYASQDQPAVTLFLGGFRVLFRSYSTGFQLLSIRTGITLRISCHPPAYVMERCTSSCLALQNREMSLTFSKWLTFGVHNAWETNKWPNGRLVRCAVVYSDNNFPKPIQRKQKGTSNVTNECRAQSSTSFNSVGGVSSPCRSTNFELSAHLITQVLWLHFG